jgi:hypothetical protein
MAEARVAANASVAASAMTTEETSLTIVLMQIVLVSCTCMFTNFMPMPTLLRSGDDESGDVEASM